MGCVFLATWYFYSENFTIEISDCYNNQKTGMYTRYVCQYKQARLGIQSSKLSHLV